MGAKLMACALVVTLLPGTAVGTPARGISWTGADCTPDVAVECGTLELPVDWNRPGGARFGMRVARVAAAEPARRLGVLVVLPGGPGDSGVDYVRRMKAALDPEVRDRFDLVGFDARGIGRSTPVVCSTGLQARRPSAYPRDDAEFDRLVAFNRELRADCGRHTGPIAEHADSASVVRDLEALRGALGERKISVFGHSYGTVVGIAYAERHGDHLRALAMTGIFDPSSTARELLERSAVAVEEAFGEFVAWCDRTPTCALHGRDVRAAWDERLARADADPTAHPTANEWSLGAMLLLYGPDYPRLAAMIVGTEAVPAPPAPRAENPAEAVFCADFRVDVREVGDLEHLAAVGRRAAPHLRGAVRQHGVVAACAGRPTARPGHAFRPHRDAPPILLLNSRFDPAGVHSAALAVERQSRGRATLVTYDGPGHNVYARTECTRGAVDRYLLDVVVPATGTHCAGA
ncbi:alpha/beta fold hydrolase [Actinosynnema sp. NPDC020468]|uniref:alpha/beta fold hydrolase n=1 Tax=Actinosynnema sp. NPDC020468 TaxID=3154488 RepID=UPI0033E3E57E